MVIAVNEVDDSADKAGTDASDHAPGPTPAEAPEDHDALPAAYNDFLRWQYGPPITFA